MKKSEFVSRVRNGLNSINKDQRIPNRYILNVGINIVKDFVSKNLFRNLLAKDVSLITYIDCLPMEPLDKVDCDIVEFKRCKDLMVSTCELPELFETSFGYSVISVHAIDELSEIEFKPIDLKQYRRNQNRQGTDKKRYYYVKGNKLYIPDSQARVVSVELITLYPEDADKCNCNPKEEDCKDIYDSKFIVPSKYIENVVKATIQEIAFKKQIPIDNNPNLNENG